MSSMSTSIRQSFANVGVSLVWLSLTEHRKYGQNLKVFQTLIMCPQIAMCARIGNTSASTGSSRVVKISSDNALYAVSANHQ